MNDLAEMALHGADAGRRWVRDHPVVPLAVAGFAVASVVVVAGGRVGAARATTSITTWLGLQDAHGVLPGDAVPGAIMLAGLVVLVLLWFVAVEVIRRTGTGERRVWLIAAAWGTPFAIGPPLMDTTVQSYVAYGLLQRTGRDPYTSSPAHLGTADIVAAIDPGARSVPSAAGPLGSLLQHAAVSAGAGTSLGALLVLRAFGILIAIWIGRLAADMGGARRAQALSLAALNPLVLLYVVSSPHLDGLMVAFLLAAITAANLRRWWSALALACLAGAITAQGYIGVPVILAAHLLRPDGRSVDRRPSRTSRMRRLRADLAVILLTVSITRLVQPNGFGWVRTIDDQFSGHTPFAPTSLLSSLLSKIVIGASFDDLEAGARVTAATAAVIAIAYLMWTARTRALERTIGYALLALALLAPTLYPWYLLWGTLCLAPTALGAKRLWVLALCGVGCALEPPGFSRTATNVITAIVLGVAAAILSRLLVLDSRRERESARQDDEARAS